MPKVKPDQAQPADCSLRTLSEALTRRDRSAFDAVYERLAGGLRRFLLKKSGGREEWAEEIAQKTWAAVWEAVRDARYDPRRSSISTFVYAVAYKMWLREMRASRSGAAVLNGAARLAETRPGVVDDPAEAAGLAETIDAVRACLRAADNPGGLTELESSIVAAIAAGESERSLAEQLGVAPSTVNARKQAAYRKLRRCLAAKGISADSIERFGAAGE